MKLHYINWQQMITYRVISKQTVYPWISTQTSLLDHFQNTCFKLKSNIRPNSTSKQDCLCWMESNDTKFDHSEFNLVSQVSKSYGYTVFGKVKHWFSLFHSNPNSTGHLIQLQNKTVYVEWSLMILNLTTLSSIWSPRFQKAMGTQCSVRWN